jgi:hypothetical protein
MNVLLYILATIGALHVVGWVLIGLIIWRMLYLSKELEHHRQNARFWRAKDPYFARTIPDPDFPESHN